MSKNNTHVPLKFVKYIFISITAIAITAAKYMIKYLYRLLEIFTGFRY